MFGGHSHAKKKYTMERVPLRIGVMIRTDDGYYDDDAIDSYKEAATKLHNIHLANDLKPTDTEPEKK